MSKYKVDDIILIPKGKVHKLLDGTIIEFNVIEEIVSKIITIQDDLYKCRILKNGKLIQDSRTYSTMECADSNKIIYYSIKITDECAIKFNGKLSKLLYL